MGVRGSKPGEHRGGRKAGTPNKTTKAVKDALLSVYDKIGGDAKFAAWAGDNLGEFYKLYVKLLPVEVKNADGEAFRIEIIEEVVGNADAAEDDPAVPPAG